MYGGMVIVAFSLVILVATSLRQDIEKFLVSKRSAQANQQVVEIDRLRDKMATVDQRGSAIGEAEMLSMGIPIGKFYIQDENSDPMDVNLVTKMFEAARKVATTIESPTCSDYANTGLVTLAECQTFMASTSHFATFNDNNLSFDVSDNMKEKMVNSTVNSMGQLQKNGYLKKSDAYSQKILNNITSEHAKQLKNKNYVAAYKIALKAVDYSVFASSKMIEDTSKVLIVEIDKNASFPSVFNENEKTHIIRALTTVMVKDEFQASMFEKTKQIPTKINIAQSIVDNEKKSASQAFYSGKLMQDVVAQEEVLPTDFEQNVADKINTINQILTQ